MTPEQAALWKQLSLGLAEGYPENGRPSRQWIIDHVESWFDCAETWSLENTPWLNEVTGYGDGPAYPCDEVDTFIEEINPYGSKWDNEDNPDVCGDYGYFSKAGNHWHEHWGGCISACIRAALNLVLPESTDGGVIGFTVGDLRRIFPDGIPKNIIASLEADLLNAPADQVLWI